MSLLLAARSNTWPFAAAPIEATYAQIVLMMTARRTPDSDSKPLPARMWQDLVALRTGGKPSWV